MKITKLFPTTGLVAAGLMLVAASTHADTPILFSIDMQALTPTEVYIRGSFNNWGNAPQTPTPLTNNGANIWSGVVVSTNSPGSVEACKFFYQPGDTWESGADRQFILAAGPAEQVLPLTTWDAKYPAPTNDVTFRVDMNAQVALGAFTNFGNELPDGPSKIRLAGSFTDWGDGLQMTNNPAAIGSLSNIFSVVAKVPGFAGSTSGGYKYRMNGGWESIDNRTFQITGGDQELPLVFYDNASSCGLVLTDTLVTFRLQITNGTAYGGVNGTAAGTFVAGTDKIYINGDFTGWKPGGPGQNDWADPLNLAPNPFETPQGSLLELTNIVPTSTYQVTVTIPKGKTLGQKYKYTINGYDNEAAGGTDHYRYIRSLSGVSYTMPLDNFGTNPVPPVVEQATGNLQIGAVSGGTIPISWPGLQCLTLQVRSSVTGGLWTDVPATDGTSSTNWPVGPGPQYFRWVKKP